jgi:hypothetical protein
MLKLGQGLTLQQSMENPGLLSRFFQKHQVLHLTEGHNPLYPILWESILKDSKVSGVLGASNWIIWIHEELQLDPLSLVCVRHFKLVHILHIESTIIGEGAISRIEGGKAE